MTESLKQKAADLERLLERVAGRWWWELRQGRECGLHVTLAAGMTE